MRTRHPGANVEMLIFLITTKVTKVKLGVCKSNQWRSGRIAETYSVALGRRDEIRYLELYLTLILIFYANKIRHCGRLVNTTLDGAFGRL